MTAPHCHPQHSPRILLMLELCMSGKACKIFLLSSFAHTMKAFMGLLMWLLFLDSGKCREPARETRGCQGMEQAPGHTVVLSAILTIHLTAQQSLIQPVGRGLLHPLLHRGRINPNVVLQERRVRNQLQAHRWRPGAGLRMVRWGKGTVTITLR